MTSDILYTSTFIVLILMILLFLILCFFLIAAKAKEKSKNPVFLEKCINIDEWDMSSTKTKTVNFFGIMLEKIRQITVIIIDDKGSYYEFLSGGSYSFRDGEITLERWDNSIFHAEKFSALGKIRGRILIVYEK